MKDSKQVVQCVLHMKSRWTMATLYGHSMNMWQQRKVADNVFLEFKTATHFISIKQGSRQECGRVAC